MTIRIYTGKFKRRNISENRKYDAYNLSSNELFLYIFKPSEDSELPSIGEHPDGFPGER